MASDKPLPITGESALYIIIGDPIAQVLSPTLFNAAFRRLGAKAVLVPYQVGAEDLSTAMAGLRKVKNLKGIIVTIPHKIALAGHVDRLGPAGECIGAINAVRCEVDGAWVGDNFDGAGCVGALKASGHELAGRRALVIGAGGAGSSVAFALAQAGVARIVLYDPDQQRTGRLIERLRRHQPQVAVTAGDNDPYAFDIVVNCSPVGMKPDDPLPTDIRRVQPGTIVVDAILKPEVTPFLTEARNRGLVTQIGRAMLEGQVAAVLQFFGFPA